MKTLLTAAAAATLLAASGCGGGTDEPAAAAVKTVNVKVFSFGPDPLEVKAGTKVTWKNQDSTTHNVVGKGFKGDLPEGGSYSHTFAKAGTYSYVCSLHSGPGMKAKVVVQ